MVWVRFFSLHIAPPHRMYHSLNVLRTAYLAHCSVYIQRTRSQSIMTTFVKYLTDRMSWQYNYVILTDLYNVGCIYKR